MTLIKILPLYTCTFATRFGFDKRCFHTILKIFLFAVGNEFSDAIENNYLNVTKQNFTETILTEVQNFFFFCQRVKQFF